MNDRMTNQALGDAIGVSQSMASRLRNGKRLPGVATLNAIAALTGQSVRELTTCYERGPEAFGKLLREGLGE